MKKIVTAIAALLIGAAAYVPLQASAQVGVNIVIGSAPPPARYERVPGPRAGYQWAPGYWAWDGHRHNWRQGSWERNRPGYRYERAEWRQRDGGWYMDRGGWKAQRHERRAERKHDKREDHRRGHDRHRDHDQHRGH